MKTKMLRRIISVICAVGISASCATGFVSANPPKGTTKVGFKQSKKNRGKNAVSKKIEKDKKKEFNRRLIEFKEKLNYFAKLYDLDSCNNLINNNRDLVDSASEDELKDEIAAVERVLEKRIEWLKKDLYEALEKEDVELFKVIKNNRAKVWIELSNAEKSDFNKAYCAVLKKQRLRAEKEKLEKVQLAKAKREKLKLEKETREKRLAEEKAKREKVKLAKAKREKLKLEKELGVKKSENIIAKIRKVHGNNEKLETVYRNHIFKKKKPLRK